MYCLGPAPEGFKAPKPPTVDPHAAAAFQFHLTVVFLLFFLLVVVLGMFSIWRLSNFNRLSADVAQCAQATLVRGHAP